ncbi:hypothetical protein VTN02DRAFT_4802 [Thermoascus thermophilus]
MTKTHRNKICPAWFRFSSWDFSQRGRGRGEADRWWLLRALVLILLYDWAGRHPLHCMCHQSPHSSVGRSQHDTFLRCLRPHKPRDIYCMQISSPCGPVLFFFPPSRAPRTASPGRVCPATLDGIPSLVTGPGSMGNSFLFFLCFTPRARKGWQEVMKSTSCRSVFT